MAADHKQQTNNRGSRTLPFATPDAEQRPQQWCAGTLKTIGELIHPKPEKRYYREQCAIAGTNGDRDQRFNLLWVPEFFSPNFRMSSLDRSSSFVYKNNIASKDGVSVLQGLCGGVDAWTDFQDQAAALPDYNAETVHEFIKEFFLTTGPVPFLYRLQQERRKEGEDETGKPIWVRGKYMEVGEFAWLDERTVAGIVRRVENLNKRIAKAKANGTDAPAGLVIRFDPAEYGIEVQLPEVDEPAWATA